MKKMSLLIPLTTLLLSCSNSAITNQEQKPNTNDSTDMSPLLDMSHPSDNGTSPAEEGELYYAVMQHSSHQPYVNRDYCNTLAFATGVLHGKVIKIEAITPEPCADGLSKKHQKITIKNLSILDEDEDESTVVAFHDSDYIGLVLKGQRLLIPYIIHNNTKFFIHVFIAETKDTNLDQPIYPPQTPEVFSIPTTPSKLRTFIIENRKSELSTCNAPPNFNPTTFYANYMKDKTC